MEALALHQIDVFDRDRAAVSEEDDQDGEPDRRLRSGDREHEKRVHLPDEVVQEGRERHEVDVDGEQDELDRHQDDDDVLPVQEDARNSEREQCRCDGQVMAEPDNHVLLPRPCPVRTLSTSMLAAGMRLTCSEILCRRTRTLCCSVSTMAPTIATSRIMPATSKK